MTLCYGQRGYNCLDSTQKAKILTWKNERDQFARIIEKQDSILKNCEEVNVLLGLEVESFKISLELMDVQTTAQTSVIKKQTDQINDQSATINKQERKIKRLKRQRVIFGVCGLTLGLAFALF